MSEPLPPHSTAAEQSVLGSMLRDNACIADVLLLVAGADFYHDGHQRIFRAIAALADQGKPVDAVTLYEVLRERKHIEDIGGPAYLAELWDAAPTAANAEYYARIVRDKALLRGLIGVASEILRDAGRPGPSAEEQLEAAEKKLFALAQGAVSGTTRPIGDVLSDVLVRIDDRQANGGRCAGSVPTGFVDLDDKTGGLQAGELAILAARTSLGKTSLAAGIARNVASTGTAVLFASLEQSALELAERILCAEAGVDSYLVRRGQLKNEHFDRLTTAYGKLRGAPIFIDAGCAQTATRLAALGRRYKLRHQIGLMVIDYLQLIDPEDRRANRTEQVGGISRRLKLMAGELGIPVLCLAQLNRQPEGRADGRPRLADLRESGSIEMDADTVLLLWRQDAAKEPGARPPIQTGVEVVAPVTVLIEKQRNGPVGEVTLGFRKQCLRYENYEEGGFA